MMRILTGAVLAVLLFAAPAKAVEESFTFGRFGTVKLYQPPTEPSGIVLFISGDGGWSKGVVDMARSLARLDAAVVGVDIRRYLRNLDASADRCSYPAADLEALSKFVQMRLGITRYRPPVLVGYSSGATLVYAVLAQAPPNTFAGSISLGFCPDLPVSKPFCRGSGLEGKRSPRGKTYVLAPARALSGEWAVLQGRIDQVCRLDQTKRFVDHVPGAHFVPLPGVGHGFSVERKWLPQFEEAYAGILRSVEEHPAVAGAGPDGLPVVELPAQDKRHDILAVVLSGDGGWAGIDREIGEDLQRRGIAVAGLNSLRYFWTARTPDSTAADVSGMLRHYLRVWNKQRIILIGYSFGADVLPFVVNRLPADLREAVQLVVLIGPDRGADFEFHLSDWLGGGSGQSLLPVLPEVRRMRGTKALCIFGTEERHSLCREMGGDAVSVIELAGGHHFGGHYSAIVDRILKRTGHLPETQDQGDTPH